jgi:hypothetical protein
VSSMSFELACLLLCVLHRHILSFRSVMGETKYDGSM